MRDALGVGNKAEERKQNKDMNENATVKTSGPSYLADVLKRHEERKNRPKHFLFIVTRDFFKEGFDVYASDVATAKERLLKSSSMTPEITAAIQNQEYQLIVLTEGVTSMSA